MHAIPSVERPTVAILLPPDNRRLVLSEAAEQRLNNVAWVHTTAETSLSMSLLRELVGGSSIWLTGWGTPPLADLLTDAPDVKLVGHFAGSIRRLIPEHALSGGLRVTHAAGAISDSVAEFVLAQILMALRHGDAFNTGMKTGQGWELRDRYPGRLLGALTVGIVGAGYVGRAVIRLLRAFHATVLLADPTISEEEARELGVERVPLSDLIERCDVVSLHAPLLDATKGLLGTAELGRLRDGALLVNMARSPLVNEQALVAELKRGRIRAILDVFDEEPLPASSPLRQLSNVYLSPHAAGHTQDSHWRQGDLIVDEVERFVRGEPLQFEISSAAMRHMA
jgi:phosphoglycerate dehydrogenase-like enzyme